MEYTYKGRDNSQFNLTDVSESKYKSAHKRDDLYKIVWAMNDDLKLGLDGYRIFLQKNHLLFATPLNQLDLDIENQDVVVYTFNREFYCIRDHDVEVSCNGFLFLGTSTPIVVALSEKEQKSFRLLYEFFVEEFETSDHIQGEMLLVLLKRLLIKSVRIARKVLPVEDMPQPKLDTLRKFNLLVEMHFRKKHKVSEYADLLHMTPKSLSNLFSRYYNKSPLRVITERIILESKRLLDFSDKNINEIAGALGFDEVSHFSKFFKTQVGLSPTEYKDQQ
jgi:AraC-like DNA-binding protein